MMSTKANEPSEGDVIVARALSTYAQLRANIASWGGLPLTDGPTEEDGEEELLTAQSETAGVGYTATEDGGAASKQAAKTSTDKLRRQMLGKKARDAHSEPERKGGPQKATRFIESVPRDDEDSDEEVGRSAVGKKRKHTNGQAKSSTANEVFGNANPSSYGNGNCGKPPVSYLDQLMAERSIRPKKKKKKDQGQDFRGT